MRRSALNNHNHCTPTLCQQAEWPEEFLIKSPHYNKAFGSWPSPISAANLTENALGLSEPLLVGDQLFWLESRPQERGRSVIVTAPLLANGEMGEKRDLLPTPLNARSKVNEYGGGSYCVDSDFIYFVLFDDQRIYRLPWRITQSARPEHLLPQALTPEDSADTRHCYGNLVIDIHHQRLIAVAEVHSDGREAVTQLVSIPLPEKTPEKKPKKMPEKKPEGRFPEVLNLIPPSVLCSGFDFYAYPSLSADASQLTWLCWNHPNMPWDGTECWLAKLNRDGSIANSCKIAGGASESVLQPRFAPNGELFLISDRSNWWNLYCWQQGELKALCPMAAEFSQPLWVFGQYSYGFVSNEEILCCFTQQGTWRLASLALNTGEMTALCPDLTELSGLAVTAQHAVFIGANSHQFPALYRLQQTTTSRLARSLIRSGTPACGSEFFAQPQALTFPTKDGASSHCFFYPPTHPEYAGLAGERPPLIVMCHGGPTGATHTALNLKIQFWTSRGFAVADLNYAGSTGYGRQYRERLNGQWGLLDVQDTVDCVAFLAATGRVDRQRALIRGGSAGGFTVLCALTFHSTFAAGASLYGIGDLEALARDTHKFESRYLDSLVGPYPAEQQLYQQRSPIHSVAQLNCPVIFLQGLKDKIVPPNQAEAMVQALDEKGIPVAYITFADQGHGFRQADNIRRALEAELYFYSRVLGFALAEPVGPVAIKHLPDPDGR